MSQRKAMNGDTPSGRLTPQQCTAVDLLVSGKTLTDTAAALGVGRPAVSDWVNHSPVFIAALNSRRQELFDGIVDALRGLLPRAVEVLKQELEGETPLPAAIQILRSCGIYSAAGRPVGPTTVEEAEQAQRQREVERAATAVTEADVQLAQRQRQQDRTFAELAVM
jgi:hypothetical protein